MVGKGHKISNTYKIKILMCLSLQVPIDLSEEQSQKWMKKARLNMKVTAMIDKTLIKRKMRFRHTATMHTTKRAKTRRMKLLKIGNGNLSKIICEFLI